MSDKYLPIHIDVSQQTVLRAVESFLNPDLLKTHSATALVRLDPTKWLLRLEFDLRKSMAADHSAEVPNE